MPPNNLRPSIVIEENDAPGKTSRSVRESGEKPPSSYAWMSDDAHTAQTTHTAQSGVQMIEATTQIWSKQMLISAYIMIMQAGAASQLVPYVTSSFREHSLTATAGVMSQVVGGLVKLPLAKVLDVWGRPQGYALCVAILTLGQLMMALCQNVETYTAAQVLYWVGYNGLTYTMTVFIADTSGLKSRALMFAFATSPNIITTWTGGPIAQALLKRGGLGFRWGFGIFALVTPIVSMPLFGLFMYNAYKVKKQGFFVEEKVKRTLWQTLKHYVVEFDTVGLVLAVLGFTLLLLPFNLINQQTLGWRSPIIIAMLVVSATSLIAFAAWERFPAPVHLFPWSLLTDRTILGACTLACIVFVSFYIWDAYFSSFLQVVCDLSITKAAYVANIYSLCSCFWSLVVGILIRWTGGFKRLALFFGVPLNILAVGLMIFARQPGREMSLIILCQALVAVAGGTCVICEQMAAMAAVSHQHVAVVLAVEAVFSSVGGALGLTIASAVWQAVFPDKLRRYLPEETSPQWREIYDALSAQKNFEFGTPTREAIARAYGDAQGTMLIVATGVLGFGLVAVMAWRDIRVREIEQVKGMVV